MSAFHDILFPLDIALKSAGGPERKPEIVALGSGREERNARWAHSRRRYDAGINGLANLSGLLMTYFGARFCVLGVYVSGRTREKQTAITGEDAPSIVGTVIKAVARRR